MEGRPRFLCESGDVRSLRKASVVLVTIFLASLALTLNPSRAQPTPQVQVDQPRTQGFSLIPASQSPRIDVNVTAPNGVVNVTLLYDGFPGVNPSSLSINDLSSYTKVAMTPLKSVSSNTTEYYYQMPLFGNDTTVWGIVEAFTGANSFASSSGPSQLYYVLTPKALVTLTFSAYLQDVNPSSLNLTIPLSVSLYNTATFEPVTVNGLQNEIYFTASNQGGECCWSGSKVASIYGYQGPPQLFPFDSYTYTIDLSLVGPSSYDNVTFNQTHLPPNVLLENPIQFSPRTATENAHDSQWILNSTALFTPATGATQSPSLEITIHLQRQPGFYQLPFEIPLISIFLLLGLSILLRRDSDISSRLLLYLSVLIVAYAFLQFSTTYISGPFIVSGYSLVVLFGLVLVPCTATLAAASIFGWIPLLRRYRTWTDVLGVIASFLVLWEGARFQVPAYIPKGNSFVFGYMTYDMTKFGYFSDFVVLALFSGVIVVAIARFFRRFKTFPLEREILGEG
jgi:hypothetical protein